jgi:DNA N-6-adenine-methyltransferase (Dam)
VPTRAFEHERKPGGGTHVWLTPRWLVGALGPFDLDPCAAPEPRPWPTAARHLVKADDGLEQPWEGRVWLNPPYGNLMPAWVERLAAHGHGTALLFARTETVVFQRHVFPVAHALFFLFGRLTFCYPSGEAAREQCGAPSVLVAYGEADAARLRGSGVLRGKFIPLR